MDKIRKIHEFVSPYMCVEEVYTSLSLYASLPHNEWVQCNALLLLNTGISHNLVLLNLFGLNQLNTVVSRVTENILTE